MPGGLSLGKGIADTNTVPGLHIRSFHAVIDGDARVSLDATNRIVIIEKEGKTGKLTAAVADTSADITLTGSAGITAQLAAGAANSLMKVVGGGGTVDIQTLQCNGKYLYVREEDWCSADGSQRGKIMVVASDPYSIV